MNKVLLSIGMTGTAFVAGVNSNGTGLLNEIENVLDYGALGNGVNDDVVAINNAIIAAYAKGGGIVYIPSGYYIISSSIKMMDNVQLIGQGYSSRIENTAETFPFTCPILTGNFGDLLGANGFYMETAYPIKTYTGGDFVVSFKNVPDASTFVVGDIVLITSYETWPVPAPEDISIHQNLNIILSKNSDEIKLLYPIMDSLSALVGDPQIRRLAGNVIGYDGLPLWACKNIRVSNLRLTQSDSFNSGYGVFAYGVNNIFENLWMDNVSSLFGSNGLSYSIVRNITGNYAMAASDFCDIQNNNLYENITARRNSNESFNPVLIGFAVYNSADCTIRKLNIDLGWKGYVGFYRGHRSIVEGCRIIAASDFGMLAGEGTDNGFYNNYINGVEGSGIFLESYNHRCKVIGNTILNVGLIGAAASIIIDGNDTEYIITNNILGIAGERTVSDRIAIYPAFTAPDPTHGIIKLNLPETVNI